MEITTTTRSSGRVLRLLVNLACLACMVVALGFIAPAAFGFQRYVITGNSMTGTIDLGSVVFAEVVPVDELEVGDVITYLPPPESGVDDLVTHRIVSIDDDVYRTQGDANSDPDPWTFRLAAGHAVARRPRRAVRRLRVHRASRPDAADGADRHPGRTHRAGQPGAARARAAPSRGGADVVGASVTSPAEGARVGARAGG